jgi:pyridoxal phosphate enzyme (YggS family)
MQAETIIHNLNRVKERMAQAAMRCGRPIDDVRLVVVGKTQTVQAVAKAIDAGANIIGENYIQESWDKFNALIDRQAHWHFIGHLQSNKAKDAVRMFDLIHSVDSEKLAVAIDKQAGKIGKIQRILVQINISGESSKSGISPDSATALVSRISRLPNLRINGLMAMPPFFNQPEMARPYFLALRQLKERIQVEKLAHVDMTELSMGMTGDFEVAIEEGATLIRIGTAIFGERR